MFQWISASGQTTAALTLISSSFLAAPGWSVQLLAQAPPTPFGVPPFSAAQQTIYAQISQKLYSVIEADVSGCTSCEQSDLRTCYPCLKTTDFTNLLGALNQYQASLTNPDPDTLAVISALTTDFMYRAALDGKRS